MRKKESASQVYVNNSESEKIAVAMLEKYSKIIDGEFEKKYTTDGGRTSEKLYRAEKYSLTAGGKRIRPALVLEVCQMFGGEPEMALPFAKAVEMIHTYSLIHDDLPCMDDDDMRRGKPSNHKVFGENYAVLAGDGLLTDAFYECAMNPYVSGDCAAVAVSILSKSAGSYGMVKGQAIDMFGEDNEISLEELVELHSNKTGALICVSAQLGALAAGVEPGDERMDNVTDYARCIGLAFQIIDDILDVTSSADVLGKNVGSDSEHHKSTFMTFFDVDKAKEFAQRYTDEAKSKIAKYEGSDNLCALADYLCSREK